MTSKQAVIATTVFILLAAPASALACGCQGNQFRTRNGQVTMEEAHQITVNYLATVDNGALRPGKVELQGNSYVVDIMDQSGQLIAKVSVNMYNGALRTQF